MTGQLAERQTGTMTATRNGAWILGPALPPRSPRIKLTDLEARINDCKEHPGEWLAIHAYAKRETASHAAERANKMPMYADFQFAYRKLDDGQHVLCAIYPAPTPGAP